MKSNFIRKRKGGGTSKEGVNWSYNDKKMNDKTYLLRREVINIIYKIKKTIPNLPRVDVRIMDSKGCAGLAGLGSNGIRINLDYCKNSLFQVVAHEIGHAVYSLQHDEKCPLMASGTGALNPHKISQKLALEILKKYSKQCY